jgi:hypothetical protein
MRQIGNNVDYMKAVKEADNVRILKVNIWKKNNNR